MEYINGGSLDLVLKKMGKIPEKFSRKITYAVSKIIQWDQRRHVRSSLARKADQSR